MKIATWNVNSLRAREHLVLDWVRANEPDVLCLQETKVTDDEFPTEGFQRLGYGVAMAGQKSYNGVAICSRKLLRNIRVGLLDAKASDDKRLISAQVGPVHVFCCYVPNGKSVDHPAFEEKLAWLGKLRESLDAWTRPEKQVLVCGDFNVARDERDLFDPESFRGQCHFHPREHERLDELNGWGLKDGFRMKETAGEHYTWWDYRAGAFARNNGLRIDYIFLSESLAERCTAVTIDKQERSRDKPSDHVPVIAEFGPAS